MKFVRRIKKAVLYMPSIRKTLHVEIGMRSPDAALIRARAKAPLPDLLALHLSSADIECIKHLDLCQCLQSLYADNNHIKDVEGIINLRKLWRIDLNNNLLKNVNAFSSFRALGFLYLERNQLKFEDLVCLRDVHLLEVRLLGNIGLLKGNTVNQYRKKVVALLPNVWILDGHFIPSVERQEAIEEFELFVVNIWAQPENSAANDSKFGSVTDVWVESEITLEDTSELSRTANLIEIAHKSTHSPVQHDLKRLEAIVRFHNAEAFLHNSHCHFASYKQSPNSRLMPIIWLDEVVALPRRTRIEIIVLLVTFLEFQYPKVLLSEALRIRQLDSPHFPSEAITDTANLPPYALVALIATARDFTIKEELLMRQNFKPEVASFEFQDESEILVAIPPLFTTLSSMKTVSVQDSTIARRCKRAIKLLSNVASFPDLDPVVNKGKGKREAIFLELLPLIRAAESDRVTFSTSKAHEVVVPTIIISKPEASSTLRAKMSWKQNTVNQDSEKRNITLPSQEEQQEYSASFTKPDSFGGAGKRIPKPGEWVEVGLNLFVKIQFLSADGMIVVGVLPSDASRTITISLDQMTRVSNSLWRVNNLTKHQMEEVSAINRHKNSFNSPGNSTRIGKLHRESEAFHRHGAARNQGFPNHFVTQEMLKDIEFERNNPTKTVEIYSSNDTLDANYVLTSLDHISAQNYCSFLQQRRTPKGLWSPMKQPPPFKVVGSDCQAASLSKCTLLTQLKMKKPRVQHKTIQQPDDWLEIRRDMQAQLGIVDDTERGMTGLSDAEEAASAPLVEQRPVRERNRLKTPQFTVRGGQKWNQVTTKTEFVVAVASLGLSHSAPVLQAPVLPAKDKLKLFVLPILDHKKVP